MENNILVVKMATPGSRGYWFRPYLDQECFNETSVLVTPRFKFKNYLSKFNYSEVLPIRPTMVLVKKQWYLSKNNGTCQKRS